ncbi:Obg family GTPase CgtA [Enterobacteriaceae endosymbiont of Plateumaris sericea]|uniref:Obg family GTPase CgtA n=1 Tax=Enterobacteriaceae endosymbiont of Plateumaris sericea TaxID=2675797 RepID=UPI001449D183|nr:Obg family GTPase CgtA [Enterobacteriaceae endosymbiont of Plateumaris sericea]QJC30183.1 Obg family GTPase CgtA [Enterobacteriaceae endosymbiont of Plateumaris sericea]
MKFFDEAKIFVTAGKGGDGCISFLREKYISKGGPNGGNGGNGGNIYLLTDHNINTLNKFHVKNNYFAENGFSGEKNQCTGKKGKDLILTIPIGTRIIDLQKKKILANLNENNQKILIVRGGKYGLGNINFKTSINRTPYQNTKGSLGQRKILKLELILIADVGMLGLPNTGKSTFVQNVSKAKTKIGNYPFTTIKPILGVVKNNIGNSFLIADIPGIIKNASLGKGLGLNFLKHLERCHLLLHLVDISDKNEMNIINNIDIINNELKKFNQNLFFKEQWLVFNKIDLLKNNKKIDIYIKKILIKFKYIKKYYLISSKNKIGIKNLCCNIFKYIKKNYNK